MLLDVSERLNVQALLPLKASNVNMKLLRKAREALSFTEEEIRLLEIKEVDDQYRWSTSGQEKVGSVDIELGDYLTGKIVEALTALDKAEDLNSIQSDLYEKFVLNKEQIDEKTN
jgi:hypothetical protein